MSEDDKKTGGHPAGIPKTGGHPAGISKSGGMPTTVAGIDLDTIADTSEKGAVKDGERQSLDNRLYVHLQAFTGASDLKPIIELFDKSGIEAVIYADINDPQGFGLLTMNESPEFFTTTLRDLLNSKEFEMLTLVPEYTMLGRTYAIGHEADLEDWLIHKPRRTAMNEKWKWAVWYPLRRTGAFSLLDRKAQGEILMEHGIIGRAFGSADLGHDIRLLCPGLDRNDNDFVIALIGAELTPLSILVETMRKTKQTSTYISNMGPFFIGRAVWQSGVK
jgi:chlorite dismutase